MMKNKESKTSVWWDIHSCPVPFGYDACRVRPCVESALEKLGFSGPVTITAMGNLKETPDHVMRALSSSGILIKQLSCGGSSIITYLLDWTNVNPPPAQIMFISDSFGVECLSRTLSWLQSKGFNILLAYQDTPRHTSDLVTCAQWLWNTLLKGDLGETRRQPLQDKNTLPSPKFSCTLCYDRTSYEPFACQSVNDFTTHLWGKEHELREFHSKERDLSHLTKDKDYLDEDDSSYPTTIVKKLSKRKLKNKVLGLQFSHLMDAVKKESKVELNKIKKKSNKRRKKFLRRMTE